MQRRLQYRTMIAPENNYKTSTQDSVVVSQSMEQPINQSIKHPLSKQTSSGSTSSEFCPLSDNTMTEYNNYEETYLLQELEQCEQRIKQIVARLNILRTK